MLVAVALSLSACSNKQESSTVRASASAAAVPAVVFNKAEAIRPNSLPAELASVNTCSFDHLNGAPHGESNTIGDKARVALNGWSADTKATSVPGPVFVELDGPVKLYVAAQRGLKRPDVVGVFNNPVLLDSGWEANIDLSAASPGSYKVRVIEVSGTSATTCDAQGTLVIVG